jgi:hypothetical protein
MSTKTTRQKAPTGPKDADRAEKRARFAEKESAPRGPSPIVLILGIVVAVAVIGGTVFALARPKQDAATVTGGDLVSELAASRTGTQGLLVSAATHGHDPYPLVEAEDGAVRLSLKTFDDYEAHHYTYMHEGRPIEFFVLKSRDGIVRAAFNACDVCFGSKKGYTQDGDYMVCNNCGRRFPADQINDVHGGCNPSPLTRTVEGDTLVIQVEHILSGLGYF